MTTLSKIEDTIRMTLTSFGHKYRIELTDRKFHEFKCSECAKTLYIERCAWTKIIWAAWIIFDTDKDTTGAGTGFKQISIFTVENDSLCVSKSISSKDAYCSKYESMF